MAVVVAAAAAGDAADQMIDWCFQRTMIAVVAAVVVAAVAVPGGRTG